MSDFNFDVEPPRRRRSHFPVVGLLVFIVATALAISGITAFLRAQRQTPLQTGAASEVPAGIAPPTESALAPASHRTATSLTVPPPSAHAAGDRLSPTLLERAIRSEELDTLQAQEERTRINAQRLVVSHI
jgi:hypothetical protein